MRRILVGLVLGVLLGGAGAFAAAQRTVTVKKGDIVKVRGTPIVCGPGTTEGGNVLCGLINADGTPYRRVVYLVNLSEKGAYILKSLNGNPVAVVASRQHSR